jgi:hypothetical protein
MARYNGYPSWPTWNVSLWVNNDEGLYRMAQECLNSKGYLQESAELMLWQLNSQGVTHTPDGAKYSVTSLKLAMRGI